MSYEMFGVRFEDGIIFTYGTEIHTKFQLPEHLIIHEMTHVDQQLAMGVDKWWHKYFENPDFRLTQELEAYQRQYKWAKSNIKDRTEVFNILEHCVKCLSGKMYGNLINSTVARMLIKGK